MCLGSLIGLSFLHHVENKYGWMDDLQFYVLLNSISVIWADGQLVMKCCVQWNSVYD